MSKTRIRLRKRYKRAGDDIDYIYIMKMMINISLPFETLEARIELAFSTEHVHITLLGVK